MNTTVLKSLKWWANLTPEETKNIMLKLFLPNVKSTNISNKQIKKLHQIHLKNLTQ